MLTPTHLDRRFLGRITLVAAALALTVCGPAPAPTPPPPEAAGESVLAAEPGSGADGSGAADAPEQPSPADRASKAPAPDAASAASSAAGPGNEAADGGAKPVAVAPAAPVEPAREVRVPVASGQPALVLQRGERLQYNVHIRLGPAEADVGTVWLESGAEPYRAGVLIASKAAAPSAAGETAWIKARAKGGYAIYHTESLLESRHLPQAWPRVLATHRTTGSDPRRQELLLGTRAGAERASYRKDTSKGAPSGTRIWRPPTERDVPAGTLDMLSAIYATRSMFVERRESIDLLMMDKLRLWKVRVGRGEVRVIDTPAGRFRCVALVLTTERHESDGEQEKVEFEGPFGLHGEMHLWVHEATGVPIKIRGTIPLGPLDLHASVALEEFHAAPPGLACEPEPSPAGSDGDR